MTVPCFEQVKATGTRQPCILIFPKLRYIYSFHFWGLDLIKQFVSFLGFRSYKLVRVFHQQLMNSLLQHCPCSHFESLCMSSKLHCTETPKQSRLWKHVSPSMEKQFCNYPRNVGARRTIYPTERAQVLHWNRYSSSPLRLRLLCVFVWSSSPWPRLHSLRFGPISQI